VERLPTNPLHPRSGGGTRHSVRPGIRRRWEGHGRGSGPLPGDRPARQAELATGPSHWHAAAGWALPGSNPFRTQCACAFPLCRRRSPTGSLPSLPRRAGGMPTCSGRDRSGTAVRKLVVLASASCTASTPLLPPTSHPPSGRQLPSRARCAARRGGGGAGPCPVGPAVRFHDCVCTVTRRPPSPSAAWAMATTILCSRAAFSPSAPCRRAPPGRGSTLCLSRGGGPQAVPARPAGLKQICLQVGVFTVLPAQLLRPASPPSCLTSQQHAGSAKTLLACCAKAPASRDYEGADALQD
jgi:hypothetical protein